MTIETNGPTMVQDYIECPCCGTEISLEMTTTIKPQNKMSFLLQPESGHRISVETIGGVMQQLGKLFAVEGVITDTIIDDIAVSEDGSIRIDFFICKRIDSTVLEDQTIR